MAYGKYIKVIEFTLTQPLLLLTLRVNRNNSPFVCDGRGTAHLTATGSSGAARLFFFHQITRVGWVSGCLFRGSRAILFAPPTLGLDGVEFDQSSCHCLTLMPYLTEGYLNLGLSLLEVARAYRRGQTNCPSKVVVPVEGEGTEQDRDKSLFHHNLWQKL